MAVLRVQVPLRSEEEREDGMSCVTDRSLSLDFRPLSYSFLFGYFERADCNFNVYLLTLTVYLWIFLDFSLPALYDTIDRRGKTERERERELREREVENSRRPSIPCPSQSFIGGKIFTGKRRQRRKEKKSEIAFFVFGGEETRREIEEFYSDTLKIERIGLKVCTKYFPLQFPSSPSLTLSASSPSLSLCPTKIWVIQTKKFQGSKGTRNCSPQVMVQDSTVGNNNNLSPHLSFICPTLVNFITFLSPLSFSSSLLPVSCQAILRHIWTK